MGFNAQLRSDIETIDVTINNYERMANATEAWGRIKKNYLEEKILQSGSEQPHQQAQATEPAEISVDVIWKVLGEKYSGKVECELIKVMQDQQILLLC